jgi:hypothetical protein
MAFPFCRHILTNGRRCHSPALRDENWCFFHARLHARHRALRPLGTVPAPGTLDLPALEDRDSVQVALSLIISSVASGKLEEKRARVLFLGLTLASRNLANTSFQPSSDYRVSSCLPTPDGLSLTLPPTNDGSPSPKSA